MPLKDLVVYLGNKRASGNLSLERAGVRKGAVIKDGVVVHASSTDPREYLGQILINLGYISEEQLNRAYEAQKQQPGVLLGKILVDSGAIAEGDVMKALSLKTRETLLEAFQWQEGWFSFDQEPSKAPADGLELHVDLLDVHREGEFRETAWQAIRSAFPSGSARLEVHEKNLPEPPKPGSLDHRLVTLIREGHTLDEMVLALHATDFYLYQRLYALYRLEAVTVKEEAADPEASTMSGATVGEELSAQQILDHARGFLDAGNFRDAESLIRRAQEMSPSPEIAALLKEAEAGLGKQLKERMMQPRKIPSLLVPQADLKSMTLTAPEKYLLSKIDGKRDVNAIVNVSPLRELEALKLIQGFVDNGLVRLD
jgi:hypothetical protein